MEKKAISFESLLGGREVPEEEVKIFRWLEVTSVLDPLFSKFF